MTQTERLIDYMQRHGGITQAEASNRLGVFRLAARIADIKAKGYEVTSAFEESKNRYGQKVRYKRYRLNG